MTVLLMVWIYVEKPLETIEWLFCCLPVKLATQKALVRRKNGTQRTRRKNTVKVALHLCQ